MKQDLINRILPDSDPRLVVQSVVQALRVQQAVGAAGRALSLAEIAKAVGIDRSAAQRFAYTLEAMGYLERGDSGNGYTPGRQLLDRGFEYLRSNPLIERATPILTELRKSAHERVDLSLFDGPTILYAVRQQSKRETFFATLVGRRIESFCTAGGRAMLAMLADDEVMEILSRSNLVSHTPRTVTVPALIVEQVRQARADGFSVVKEEFQMGEIALAAAIRGASGRPAAAVHIAGSLAEWQEMDFRNRFAPLAMAAAAALSK